MLFASIWRLLLSMLLVVVLPLEGYAATHMLACQTPEPVSLGAKVERDKPHRQVAAADIMTTMHDHHHGAAAMAMAQDDNASLVMDETPAAHLSHPGDSGHHDPADGKCPGCAPCCMRAALTPSLLVHERLPAGHAGFAAPAAAHASAYIGLPDRPPQAFLA